MEATTRRRPARTILRAVSGHPKASAGVLAALFVAGLLARWATQLWGLPDVGDPFDVAAFDAVRIPDNRNAFVEYRYAAAMLDASLKRKPIKNHDSSDEWSKADQSWRDLVADAREALDTWKVGTERPDSLAEYRGVLGYRTLLPVADKLGMLARLAALEGSRLEGEGDPAGAWGWHRAALRSSRHSGRHGFWVERKVGVAIHRIAAKALTRWASDPRVDAPMLRRALDEVIAIDAMTAPASDSIKRGYLAIVSELNNPASIVPDSLQAEPNEPPDWCRDLWVGQATKVKIQSARAGFRDDYGRGLRVARLLAANWLAQVDRPPALRARLAHEKPPIYELDPTAPTAARALPPEALAAWYDASLFARHFDAVLTPPLADIQLERARQAKLVVHLATELYRREHGAPSPSPEALVGPYLKALPEGFDAPDEPTTNRP